MWDRSGSHYMVSFGWPCPRQNGSPSVGASALTPGANGTCSDEYLTMILVVEATSRRASNRSEVKALEITMFFPKDQQQ
jgi:hypothetical protein